MLYRIYTEDVNRHRIERLAGERFQGFTILTGTGHWEGTQEDSLVVEIIGGEDLRTQATDLAEAIRDANGQQAVLVQALENESWLV